MIRPLFLQILKDKFGSAKVPRNQNRSHLVKKVITNKRGKKQTVYVNPNKNKSDENESKTEKNKNPLIAARYDLMSAEKAFSDALKAEYGKDAPNKRYSYEKHPEPVQSAKDRFIQARDKYHSLQDQAEKEGRDRLSGEPVNEEPEKKPEENTASQPASQAMQFVPVSQIRELSQYTDKKDYDRPTIEGIKASILANGYNPAFPLQVDSDGKSFNIVSGHHRFTAVQELIKEGKISKDVKIPVVVQQYNSEGTRLMAQMAENIRRVVNPMDEAKAIGKLTDLGHTPEEIAKNTGMNVGKVRRRQALNRLTSELATLVKKKDRSLPIGIAEAIGTHGLKPDGTPNSTIQLKAHKFYRANKHRGFGAAEVISYMEEMKSQETQKFWEDSEVLSDVQKESLRTVGSEEKTQRNTALMDKFINQMQQSFQRLLGDTIGSANPNLLKELTASILASGGEDAFNKKMDTISVLLKDLESVKDMLQKNYNNIKAESSNMTLAFARSMAMIDYHTNQIQILKGKPEMKSNLSEKVIHILKAARSRAHLVKKVITNKKGKKQTVYVNPGKRNKIDEGQKKEKKKDETEEKSIYDYEDYDFDDKRIKIQDFIQSDRTIEWLFDKFGEYRIEHDPPSREYPYGVRTLRARASSRVRSPNFARNLDKAFDKIEGKFGKALNNSPDIIPLGDNGSLGFIQVYRHEGSRKVPPGVAVGLVQHYVNTSPDAKTGQDKKYEEVDLQEFIRTQNNAIANETEIIKKRKLKDKETAIEAVDTALAQGKVKKQNEINKQVKNIIETVPVDQITDEQKEILKLYEGEGGQTRNDQSDYVGKGLLYEFYTPRKVIDKSWNIIDRYMKPGAKILEPAAGIGRFAEGKSEYKFDMLEVDETSSKIASILHPGSSVKKMQFEEMFLDERNRSKKNYDGELYDAVVTNPPYGAMGGKYKPTEGKGWTRYEEYFIHRSLDTVKEGGIVAMVVPSTFLQKGEGPGKKKIFQKAELLEAHRLPRRTFAHTDIGTDLIVLRKNTTEHKDVSNAFSDQYFKDNPDHIHGEEKQTTDRFGKPITVVEGKLESFLKHKPKKPVPMSQAHKDAISRGLIGNKNAAGKHKVTKEKKKAVKKAAVKNATVRTKNTIKEQKGPPPVLLNQKEFNEKYGITHSEKDFDNLKNTNALGYLDPSVEFDTASMSVHDGGKMPDYLYATGNIYDKLEQLESEKEFIISEYGLEQYQKQKNMLEAAKPEPVDVKDIVFDPIDPFVQSMEMSDGRTLIDHFSDWLSSLDYSVYRGTPIGGFDIRSYIDGDPVRGKDKRENERRRKDRREYAIKFMNKFINENITESQKNEIKDSWNRLFRGHVQVDPSKVPIPIEGLNSKFKGKDYNLRDVQQSFISNFISKGAGCAAHEVGLGKTMTGIIGTVSNMQLGRCSKPLFVVPTSVLSNWEASVKSLYPNLTVNTIGTPELNSMTEGGKELEIPEGSVTVMSYDAFTRMGFSEERFNELTKDLQDDFTNPYEDKTKREQASEQNKLEALAGKAIKGTDKNLQFDKIGFDHITVDEAHNFNNIFTDVKAKEEKNFRGQMKKVQQANEFQGIIGAGKASDRGMKLYTAAQHVLKENDGRNIMLLTATPFTNNPLQVYSLLSIMAKERLKEMGIHNVKDFVSMFVETQSEFTMEANGKMKEKTTVRRFKNGHAFSSLITEFFDRKTGEEAGVKRPDLVEKELVLPSTKEMDQIRASLERYYDTAKEEDKGAALKSMTLQQNMNISPALVKDNLFNPDRTGFVERSPKMTFVAKSVAEYYKKMTEKEGNAPGQIVFLPRGVEYFKQVKDYLVKQGVPADAIEIMTPKEKNQKAKDKENKKKGMSRFDEIKFDFNDKNGKCKIIIGSDTIQEGVSLQKNTGVMYNCSLAWNPTNNEQKKGRGWRHGNERSRVHMFYPVIENSIDTKLFQKHAEKVSRINDIFKTTGKSFIETAEINPDELKYDIITDPEKKAQVVAVEQIKAKRKIIYDKETDLGLMQSVLNRANKLDERIKDSEESIKVYTKYKNRSAQSDYWDEHLKKEKSRLSSAKRAKDEHMKTMQEKGLTVESLTNNIQDMEKEIDILKKSANENQKELIEELTVKFKKEKEEAEKMRPNKTIDQLAQEHVEKLILSSTGDQVYKSRLYEIVKGRIYELRYKKRAV